MTYTDHRGRPLNWHRQACCQWEAHDLTVHGHHQHDLNGVRVDPSRVSLRGVERPDPTAYRAGQATRYVWFEFLKLCRVTGMAPTVTDVECCQCHRTVSPGEAYSAVAIDSDGRPRSGFLHCATCRILYGAGTAWQSANDQTAKPVPDSATMRG